jgi:hypothetical protein
MADSAAFEWTCEELEQISSLDRLEARGTVRLALKQAGLEARNVSPNQMKVVLEKVLPGELETRGIDGAAGLCSGLLPGLAAVVADAIPGEMPDEIFRRLGGS